MAFRDVTVEGVEYRLILADDKWTPRREPLEGLDALVLDTTLLPPSFDSLPISTRNSFSRFNSPLPIVENHLDHLQEHDIPIYTVNPSFKEGKIVSKYVMIANILHAWAVTPALSTLSGFSTTWAQTILLIPYGVYASNANSAWELPKGNTLFEKIRKGLFSTYSFFDAVSQSPTNEGINAIAATKIKYGVVPHLVDQDREKYSGRPPRIAIIYDGKHRGLLQCLKNDLRSRTTSFVQGVTQLYRVMDPSSISRMNEYRISEGELTSKTIELPYRGQVQEQVLLESPTKLITNKSL